VRIRLEGEVKHLVSELNKVEPGSKEPGQSGEEKLVMHLREKVTLNPNLNDSPRLATHPRATVMILSSSV